MSTKNPNHEVTRHLEENNMWHKLMAAVMVQQGLDEIVIGEADVTALESCGKSNVAVIYGKEDIRLRLVSDEEADELARDAGGLPS